MGFYHPSSIHPHRGFINQNGKYWIATSDSIRVRMYRGTIGPEIGTVHTLEIAHFFSCLEYHRNYRIGESECQYEGDVS